MIHIVLEGLRGEDSIDELKNGVLTNLFCFS